MSLSWVAAQQTCCVCAVVMPPSALQTLSHMQVQYPMLFKLSNDAMQLSTHVGTLEFTAQEGHIHVPRWLMTSLALQEGSIVTLTNVSLPRANWVKLQPQHKSFLDLSNPKAILEKTLQRYSCMTKGKAFTFTYLNKEYTVLVEDVKPAVRYRLLRLHSEAHTFFCRTLAALLRPM